MSKNRDTHVAPEDYQELNDVYPSYQQPNFRLRSKPPTPHQGPVAQPQAESDLEEQEIDTYQSPALKDPSVPKVLMQ